MEKKRTLKQGIYVDEDLTRVERRIQRMLRERAREERKKGNAVRVGYGKLKINEVWLFGDRRKEMLVDKKRIE